MGQSPIMLIILVVFAVAFAIYFMMDKKKKEGADTIQKEGENNNSNNGVKKNKADVPRKDMSDFIHFDKVANDMIYQKNGEKYTMVIECKGINYELMSEIEQMAVEEGFVTFLNTLKYPIQLYVQTRSIDLNENIKKYKSRAKEFEERRQDAVEKYNLAEDDIDISKEELYELRQQKLKFSNIAEYVSDITKYVERLSLNKFLLQRKFYVIISYNKSEVVTTEKFTPQEYEDMCFRELYTRAHGIIGSLLSCSVQGRILNSNELAELIYISLNRDDQKTLGIKEALDSGFYRLYSTSDDVRMKKKEALDEEIKQESLKRVGQAIMEGIANGTIIPEQALNDELDKQIDKTAIKMVDEANINNEAKEEIKNIILTKRREKVKKIQEEREKAIREEQAILEGTIDSANGNIQESYQDTSFKPNEVLLVNDLNEDNEENNSEENQETEKSDEEV